MIISNLYNPENREEGCAIYRQFPQKRIISVKLTHQRWANDYSAFHRKNIGTFFLSFPTIEFKIFYHKYQNTFVRDSLKCVFTNLKGNKYYIPCFYNLYGCGTVCTNRESREPTLEILFETSINDFWSSNFCLDLSENVGQYFSRTLGSFEKWQKKTKNNPNWIPRNMIPLQDDDLEHYKRAYDE